MIPSKPPAFKQTRLRGRPKVIELLRAALLVGQVPDKPRYRSCLSCKTERTGRNTSRREVRQTRPNLSSSLFPGLALAFARTPPECPRREYRTDRNLARESGSLNRVNLVFLVPREGQTGVDRRNRFLIGRPIDKESRMTPRDALLAKAVCVFRAFGKRGLPGGQASLLETPRKTSFIRVIDDSRSRICLTKDAVPSGSERAQNDI